MQFAAKPRIWGQLRPTLWGDPLGPLSAGAPQAVPRALGCGMHRNCTRFATRAGYLDRPQHTQTRPNARKPHHRAALLTRLEVGRAGAARRRGKEGATAPARQTDQRKAQTQESPTTVLPCSPDLKSGGLGQHGGRAKKERSTSMTYTSVEGESSMHGVRGNRTLSPTRGSPSPKVFEVDGDRLAHHHRPVVVDLIASCYSSRRHLIVVHHRRRLVLLHHHRHRVVHHHRPLVVPHSGSDEFIPWKRPVEAGQYAFPSSLPSLAPEKQCPMMLDCAPL